MEKNWFIFKGDHHLGPFSSEDLVRMLQHEKALPDDLIWREGEADWLPLSKHPALLAFFEPPKQEEPKPVAPIEEEFILKEPIKEEYVDDFLDPAPQEEDEEEEVMPPPLPPLPVMDELEPEPQPEPEPMPPPLPPLPVMEEEHISEPEPEPEPEVEPEPEFEPMPTPEPEPEVEAEYEPEPQVEPVLDDEIEPVAEEKILFDDFAMEEEELLDEDDDATRDKIAIPESIWEEAPTWQKVSMSISLILGLLMSLHFFNWEGSDIEATRFSGVSRDKKKRLTKIVHTEKKLGVKAELALSNTGNEIWLATNKPGEAIVYLSLKSLKDRIITKTSGEVELRSVGELVKGGAKFRNIELVKGERIAEGEYDAYLVGYATGWKSRLVMYLREINFFKTFKFVNQFEPDFKLSIPFLYSLKPVQDFEKLLGENRNKKKQYLLKPYKELMQRHKTFSSLLIRVKDLYRDSLKKMNKGSDVKLFERRYAFEIEPPFKSLLLDSIRLQTSLVSKDKKRSDDYGKLVEEGKEIGILVSDIVTRTRKYGKMTDRKRKKLEGIFAPRIEEILKISKEDTLRLESEMKRFLAD